MKVLIIGEQSPSTRQRIRELFPAQWELCFSSLAEAERELADAEVLLPEHLRVDEALLRKAPRLKLVQTGAGYDNIDLEACTRAGVQVCNAAGVNADAVAEHVLALLLCRYKNLLPLDGGMKAHREVRTLDYAGGELAGKTIGLVGLGAVGKRVAALCRAFGMRVLAYTRSPFSLEGVEAAELDRLLCESDVVSLHVPLTEATRHLIDARALARMKPDALLINTARGAVVDEAALIRALRERRIGGACLDVFETEPLPPEHPLRDLDNVILTPHTAGLPDGPGFHRKRYAFFVRNIEKVLRGETPESRLNFL